MAKLKYEATGVIVEVANDKVAQLKKHGFVEIETSTPPKKTGAKNGSKSK